jgi:hypothetical protein
MSTITYGLRAEFSDSYRGGVVRIDDARELNVLEELEANAGVITVDEDDIVAVNALENYQPLKRLRGQAAADRSSEPTVSPYADLTVEQLQHELSVRHLRTTGRKADLIDRLGEHDTLLKARDDEALSAFIGEHGVAPAGAPDAGVAGSTGNAAADHSASTSTTSTES